MRTRRAYRVHSVLLFLLLGAVVPGARAQNEGSGADREWRFIEKLRADGMQDLALRQLENFAREYATDPRAPGALLEAAQGEAALDRPVRARELCEDLLKRFPSAPQAPAAALLRADQLSEEARFEPAAEAYRSILSAYPASSEAPAARLGLGEALMSLGRGDEARRLFAGLTNTSVPGTVAARARYDLGVLEVQAGADSLAILRFDSIHVYHPQEPIGAFGLVRAAELLVKREANAEATKRYEQVIKEYNNPVLRSRARLGLAALIEQTNPKRAVELYRAVLEDGAAADDLKGAYLGLGRAALASKDYELAGSISTAFVERFAAEPEVDQARLIRAQSLLADQPDLGVEALVELGRSPDAEVAWAALEILARREQALKQPDQAALRWRQAEASAPDATRRAQALLEQTRIAMGLGQFGLAADLGVLIAKTAEVDSVAARGLQLSSRARAQGGDLAAAITVARQCSGDYPLTPAAARARADLAVWTRMSVADPGAAADALAALALDSQPGAPERALRVGIIQRDLLADHDAARQSLRRARDAGGDPAHVSQAELELARNAQLAALSFGLRAQRDDARASLREAREALVAVASRPGAETLASRGRMELLGLDLAAAARPDAPWLFDPRTMPLLGAVGPAEDVDLGSEQLRDTRRRIETAMDGAQSDALAWLAWRRAELSTEEVTVRLAYIQSGMAATTQRGLQTALTYTRGQLHLLQEMPGEAARDLASVVEQNELVELSLAARYGLAEAQRSLKRYDQAGVLYEEFAAAWPDTRRGQRALLLAGDCALFAGRPADAVATYRALLTRYPASVYRDDTLYRLGTALERDGKLEAARTPLTVLVDDKRATEYRGRALSRLARIEESAGQDSLAVVALTRLVEEDPPRAADEDAWLRIAQLELDRVHPDQALRWARRMPETGGDAARATALEVQALCGLGKTGDAAKRLEELSLAHPDRPELVAFSRVVLAEAQADAGKDELAAASFSRARSESADPATRARCAYGEGMVAVRAQRWADARQAFESARDLAPLSEWAAEALYKLGQLYLRDGESDAARAAFSSLVKDFPQHERAPQALRAEAQVWRQDGHYDEALKVYHRILDEYPDVEGAEQVLANIAYCHHEMGQYEVSIAAYERVMPLLAEEDQAYAQFWTADSLDQLGRYEEAAAAFLRIPYLYPSMGQLGVTAQLKAGEAWEHQGDADAARQIYERVLAAQGAGTEWGLEASRRLERLNRASGG